MVDDLEQLVKECKSNKSIHRRLLVSRNTILLYLALAMFATVVQNFRLIDITTQIDVGSILHMNMGTTLSNFNTNSNISDRYEHNHNHRI